MLNHQSTNIDQQLRQIVNMLLLNGTLVDCPGLIHGKMGVAIFFFFYARHAGNRLFEDYALDLIAEIQEQIHINSPANYEKGIAGIGVGIDYLIRNDFLDADDDIFDDFDLRMYRAVMHDPWQDLSLYNGVTGYGKYWISRLHQQESSMQARKCLSYITGRIKKQLPNIPENELTDVYCFIHELQKISDFNICNEFLEQCMKQSTDNSRSFYHLGDSSIGGIIRMYQCNHYFGYALHGEIDLKQIQDFDMVQKPPVGMGLLAGYAGEGMLRLTMLNNTTSWIYLL